MSKERLNSPKGVDDLSEVEELNTPYQSGYDLGKLESKDLNGPGLNAFNEGAHLGHHRGVALGQQIGYYHGVLVYYQAILKNNPKIYNDKIVKQLTKLNDLIKDFPVKNVDQDIDALTTEIQGHYKKLCSLLKIKPFNPDANFISF